MFYLEFRTEKSDRVFKGNYATPALDLRVVVFYPLFSIRCRFRYQKYPDPFTKSLASITPSINESPWANSRQ